ncbi:PIG-L family deacetylase [Actinomycetospora sp. OC33-EN08]|uniref:PIG-L family deacetylase n=1 Tax=Actinomycetospora aurantiaca TaxID=3129233 RepID=A0ABU8MLP1_9PSEU
MTVIAVSPHLDDAVFSVGGTLARLGADTLVVTCFTGSTDPAVVTPFGLSTQLDKGLAADVDYMALRREEDRRALETLGVTGRHLGLLEAPHRGYDSAPELFAGRHDDDVVAGPLAEALAPLLADADVVLAPQALGDHVDHQWVSAVVSELVDPARVAWWRDTPYVLRRPDAVPMDHVAGREVAVDVASVLERKVAAACCYVTQVPFQFGSDDDAGAALGAAPAEVLRAGGIAREVLGGLTRGG